jgi:hypothetical protein
MRIVTLGLIVSFGAAVLPACVDDANPPDLERSVLVDKRAEAVTTFRELLSCDYLIGMSVCSMEYVGAMHGCGYNTCLSMCLEHPEASTLGVTYCEDVARQCGENYAAGAAKHCGYLHEEWWLCEAGYADPATCTTGPGGGGGGTVVEENGEPGDRVTCTWCSCTSDVWVYEGEVCGSSTDELVEACWGSC